MQISEEDTLRVRKQDGSVESWNEDKLITSIARSGLNIDSAQKVADTLQTWAIKQSSKTTVIDSSKLREKVIEILEAEYPLVANTYKTYKKG
jgi:hypothetical protein